MKGAWRRNHKRLISSRTPSRNISSRNEKPTAVLHPFHLPMEAYQLTATQVLASFRDGSLTVEDYARSLLSRIEQRDATVKAWAHLDPEYVIKQAKALDQTPAEQRGPLHVVAVAVKDIIYTKGKRVSFSTEVQLLRLLGFAGASY